METLFYNKKDLLPLASKFQIAGHFSSKSDSFYTFKRL